MPTTTEILAGLTRIANDGLVFAAAWHLAVGAVLVALALGWRPRIKTAGLMLSALPASASGFAFASGNGFNGVVLAGLSIALGVLSMRGDGERVVRRAPGWAFSAGAASIAFGWLYPHFLSGSPLQYLYAAPLGLVPCPTLAVALGFALITDLGDRRAWSLVLAGVAAFYGLFGVLRLGVALDLGLVAGALALARHAVGSVRRRQIPITIGASKS
jgi:hypothetical protein